MSESIVRDLIARMASDPEFARNVAGNPAGSLAGYDLTDDEREALARLGADTSAKAQPLGERLSKSALFVPTSGAHAEAARQAVASTEVPHQPDAATDAGPVHHEFEQVHHLYSHGGYPTPGAPSTSAEQGTGFAGINRALSAGHELPPAHLTFGTPPTEAHAAPPVQHAGAAPPVHHTAAAPPVHHTAPPPPAAHAPSAAPPTHAAVPPPPAQAPAAPGAVRPPEQAAPPVAEGPTIVQSATPAPAAAAATEAATTATATAAAATAAHAPAAAVPPVVVTAPTVPAGSQPPAPPVVDVKAIPAERAGPVTFGGAVTADTLTTHPPTAAHAPAPSTASPPPSHFQPWTQNPTGHAAPPTAAPHAPTAPHSSGGGTSGGGGGGGGGGAPGKILVTPPVPGETDVFPQLTFPEDKNPPPSWNSTGPGLGPPPPGSATTITDPETGATSTVETPGPSSYTDSAAANQGHFAVPLPPDNAASPAGGTPDPSGGGYGTNVPGPPAEDLSGGLPLPPVPSFGAYPAPPPDAGQSPQTPDNQALAAANADPNVLNPIAQTDLTGGGGEAV